MADNKIDVQIDVTGNAEVQFKKVGDAALAFETKATKSAFSFARAWETASGVVAGAAIYDALKAAAGAVVNLAETLISDGVKAAEEAQVAQNRLNQALAQAGEYSEEASDRFSSFAAQIQRTTTVEDDAVRSAAALLESMAQLSEKGLEAATKTAIDMSAALGIDLDTAVRMVGKAANGEVGSFKKLGISIEEGDTKAETLANTLEVLNGKFGGSAAAQVKTFAGATEQLKNNFGDFQEEIGNVIVKNNAFVEVTKEISTITSEFADATSESGQALREMVANGLVLAIQATEAFVLVGNAAGQVVSASFRTIETAVLAAGYAATKVLSYFSDDFATSALVMEEAVKKSAESIGKSFTEDTKLGEVATILARVEQAAIRGTDALKEGVSTSVAPINGAKVAIDELTEAQIKLGEEGLRVAERLRGEDPALKYQRDLAALQEAQAQELELSLGFEEAKAALALERDAKTTELRAKELADLNAKNEALKALDADRFAAEIAGNQAKIDRITSSEGQFSKIYLQQKQKEAKAEVDIRMATAASAAGIFGNLSTAAKQFGAEGFAIAQGLAKAQALVNTYAAAQAAYTSTAAIPVIGAGLAPIAAAAAVAAGLANVAQINATRLSSGIDSVPAGFERDNFPAMLQSGERVVPKDTNKDLKSFLSGDGPMVALLQSIDSKLSRLQTVVNIDGREVFSSMRSQLQSGRAFT